MYIKRVDSNTQLYRVEWNYLASNVQIKTTHILDQLFVLVNLV